MKYSTFRDISELFITFMEIKTRVFEISQNFYYFSIFEK